MGWPHPERLSGSFSISHSEDPVVNYLRVLLAVVLTVGLLTPAAFGEEEDLTLAEAITKGKPILTFRYRYENVNEDAFDKDAHASTLRTVVGYKTRSWKGLGFHIEAENVTTIGNDLYNNIGAGDLNNGVTDRPVVGDPAITDLNQVFFWFNKGGSSLQLGREQINVDDQRFIGAVAWRQHHQSFDAFKFTNESLQWANFLYSYINKVHRINGATWDSANHLLNARFQLGEGGKYGSLTPYAYLLDFENAGQFGLSTSSYGLEYQGKYQIDPNKSMNWEVEYANQSDYGNNPDKVDADYLFLTVQGKFKPLNVRLGYGVLGGSVRDGRFTTPLATLHKFNGWADKFLGTPITGLQDLYLALDGKIGPVKWFAIYHDFSADGSTDLPEITWGSDYGTEFDFQLLYTAPWKQGFGFKGALYSADTFSTDTNKFWIFTTWKI